MFQPVLVLSQNTKRDSGNKVRSENIAAAKMIAEVVRTCLGPRAMLKMLMDPMGGIVMTNDGNAILREIIVQHPAGKMIIELARTQDEEVGDGTTSVVILCGQILAEVEKHIDRIHPTLIIKEFRKVLDDILKVLPSISKEIDLKNDKSRLIEVVKGCLGTKFLGGWSEMACSIAITAVETVRDIKAQTIDLKNFVRVEKVPGGVIEESTVLEGVMLNKDVTHPRMARMIKNPRILLLDCSLEYKKGESQTNIEIVKEGDYTRILQIEEEYIQKMCKCIIEQGMPNIVITEKGISDLAQHYLMKAGITAIRRVKKTDNNRIARAINATIVSRVEEIKPHHIGCGAGLFEVKKIGDEYFTFITECKNPKACTILLRGPSKDILNEAQRNLQDAMNVVRNIYLDPRVLPGGGAVEMALYKALLKEKSMIDYEEDPYAAIPSALRLIPRTLLQNAGGNIIRSMNELEKWDSDGKLKGVDGFTGEIVEVDANSWDYNVWEPYLVKVQIYKTAIEAAIMLLKIDDIVSGAKNKDKDRTGPTPAAQPTEESFKE